MTKRQQLFIITFKLGVITALAYFLASGTSVLLAAQLKESLKSESALSTRYEAKRHRPPRHRAATISITDGDPILRRNIFDSVTGAIYEDTSEQEHGWDDDEVEDKIFVSCSEVADVKASLDATVADPERPGWSFASVEQGKESSLVRIGDLLEGRTVRDITWRYLLLEGEDEFCYMDLFSKEEKRRRRVSKPSKGKRLTRRDIRKAIKKVGPYKRVVDQIVFEQALANPTRFMREVSVRPHKKRGKVDGFRLRRVRRRSVFEELGAKVGDVVHSVNGTSLNSVESALIAYQELRSASSFTFDITRKGKPISLEVSLR